MNNVMIDMYCCFINDIFMFIDIGCCVMFIYFWVEFVYICEVIVKDVVFEICKVDFFKLFGVL